MIASPAHEFAVHYAPLSKEIVSHDHLIISQEAMMHRLIRVLRLEIGDRCILFDENYHALVEFVKIDRSSCTVRIISKEKNQPLYPTIRCYLPILKREAFEEAAYELTEIGCNEIQIITTEKKHRTWGGQKEFERLQKIIIAACEQAKQFSIPHILPPISIENALQKNDSPLFLCDPQGAPFEQVLSALKNKSSIAIISGPEGGFTSEEINIIQKSGSVSVQLTPTILRAQKAIVLAAGMFRCFVSTAGTPK